MKAFLRIVSSGAVLDIPVDVESLTDPEELNNLCKLSHIVSDEPPCSFKIDWTRVDVVGLLPQ